MVSRSSIWVDIYVHRQLQRETQAEIHEDRPSHVEKFTSMPTGATMTAPSTPLEAQTGSRFSLLPPEECHGQLRESGLQRIPVRIRIDKGQDENHLLRPGMSVVPTVMTKMTEGRSVGETSILGSSPISVMLGTFMEVLDTTVINVSLTADRRRPLGQHRRSPPGCLTFVSRGQHAHRAAAHRLASATSFGRRRRILLFLRRRLLRCVFRSVRPCSQTCPLLILFRRIWQGRNRRRTAAALAGPS